MSHHLTAAQISLSTPTSTTSTSVTPPISDNNNNNDNTPSSTSFSLAHLPHDVLLQICDRIDSRSLRALSQTSRKWHAFCNDDLWARRIAAHLGVQHFRLASVHVKSSAYHDDNKNNNNNSKCKDQFYNILQRLEQCKYSNERYICVHLQPSDSLSGLSLKYAISRDDLCRANNLYAERQLAAKQFIYVPVSAAASSPSLPPHHEQDHDNEQKQVCQRDKHHEHVTIVRDIGLSNKLFPVVACHHQHESFTDWHQSHDNNTYVDNADNGGGEFHMMHSHHAQGRQHVHNPSISLRIFRAPLSHYRVSFTTVVRGRHIRNP